MLIVAMVSEYCECSVGLVVSVSSVGCELMSECIVGCD